MDALREALARLLEEQGVTATPLLIEVLRDYLVSLQGQRDSKRSRDMDVLKLREAGMSFSAIAKHFGLTYQSIQQICNKTLRDVDDKNS